MTSQQLKTDENISISCIDRAAAIICAKWTALIVRQLAMTPKRFCELEEAVEGINPRILSQRLEELHRHKIISKKIVSRSPLRTEYSLTAKGQDLIPILESMAAWGEKHKERNTKLQTSKSKA